MPAIKKQLIVWIEMFCLSSWFILFNKEALFSLSVAEKIFY